MIELICKQTCSTCRRAVALLDERKVAYRYREYTQDPLSADEIRAVLAKLGVGPREVLRTHDSAYAALNLSGDESDETLISLMAEHPTLLQRPIGVRGDRAALGRPVEGLLALLD